jgi:uncharacterized protein YdhG (YjbR/CyaY superfamily)
MKVRMTEKKHALKGARGSTNGFTEEERAAMKERARELRARTRSGSVDGEREVLAKIAEMQPADRAMAERLHAIIKSNAPALGSKTWYGMPAYCKDGDVVCFFQPAGRFKTRYATLGFSDESNLDDGHMWPTGFAVTAIEASEEARIVALLKRAVG